MFEYTSAVFAVGLEGFAPVDNDRITAMAADGWEPTQMASIHGGFAAVVLFRRQAPAGRVAAARAASAVPASAKKRATPTPARARVRRPATDPGTEATRRSAGATRKVPPAGTPGAKRARTR